MFYNCKVFLNFYARFLTRSTHVVAPYACVQQSVLALKPYGGICSKGEKLLLSLSPHPTTTKKIKLLQTGFEAIVLNSRLKYEYCEILREFSLYFQGKRKKVNLSHPASFFRFRSAPSGGVHPLIPAGRDQSLFLTRWRRYYFARPIQCSFKQKNKFSSNPS